MKFVLLYYFLFLTLIISYKFNIVVDATMGTIQRYAAKGKLSCGQTAAANVLVKLVDIDRLGFDDVMSETRTGTSGQFYIEGKTAELTPIDPVLKFYHDCNDDYVPCQRRWKMFLPKTHILNATEDAAISDKVFDVGELNLEAQWKEEFRSCVH